MTFDPAPVIKDNIIKKEMKNRERIGIDSTGDKDSLAVIPYNALLNGTSISNGKLTTNNKVVNGFSDFFMHDLITGVSLKVIKKFFPESSKFMRETAYQNNTNANMINQKIRKDLLKKHPDINDYLELLQRKKWFLSSNTTAHKAISLENRIKEYEKKDYIKKYNESQVGIFQNHQVGIVDSKVDKFVKEIKKDNKKEK